MRWKSGESTSDGSYTNESTWDLIPLVPTYLEGEHSGYVSAIECALKKSEIRNIALTGNFGLGKSSILREVAQKLRGRVVELSLSTLAPIELSHLDNSIPKQATTTTNRIQHEIVKQLIYREKPGRMPGSRFRRIERFNWWRELAIAVLFALALTTIFLVAGWTAKIAAALVDSVELGLWVHPILFAAALAECLSVRHVFHGRIHIKQLSAGPTAITLDDRSVSYFDQYLDEIVYFLEVSGHDILIFEDIDRFDDSHIFETLRSLNTLLNASPQIGKPIRFIYAIKDSIFDSLWREKGSTPNPEVNGFDSAVHSEIVRANRTKFFDLVIPVVPFITHRSARNLVAQLLGDKHEVSPELLDLASRYVPDMRLIKNIRNEFIVFGDRIFSGDGERLALNKTDLFAMMLYKSTHLTDFEAIRLGMSKLDKLYAAARDLVAANIKSCERSSRKLVGLLIILTVSPLKASSSEIS